MYIKRAEAVPDPASWSDQDAIITAYAERIQALLGEVASLRKRLTHVECVLLVADIDEREYPAAYFTMVNGPEERARVVEMSLCSYVGKEWTYSRLVGPHWTCIYEGFSREEAESAKEKWFQNGW